MKEVFISARKVNLIGVFLVFPISFLTIVPFYLKWSSTIKFNLKTIKTSLHIFSNPVLDAGFIISSPVFVVFLGLVIHELIHGIFMFFFTKNNWESIRFGFIAKYLMPYANCKKPLVSKQMLIVSLAPFILLGFLPLIYAYVNGSLIAWFFGFSMTLGAVGDFIYSYLIITKGWNHIILDHDTEVGFKIID